MIFLSYARSNLAAAESVRKELEVRGHRVWHDTEEIQGSSSWPDNIQTALHACERLVLLQTVASSKSDQVLKECFFFTKKRKPLHILLLEPSEPNYQLLMFQSIDGHANFDEGINRLDQQLRAPFHFPSESPTSDPPEPKASDAIALLEQFNTGGAGAIDRAAMKREIARTPVSLRDYLAIRALRVIHVGISAELIPDLELATEDRDLSSTWRHKSSSVILQTPIALLEETNFSAVVAVGEPGAGKSTLLRSLELELSLRTLKDYRYAAIPFCVSLSELTLPDSLRDFVFTDWLAGKWKTRCPRLPPLINLIAEGRVVFLLDGLNEIGGLNPRMFLELCRHLRAWLADTCPPGVGNRAVFTCRTLDYADHLSSKEHSIPLVKLRPLQPTRVLDYLRRRLSGADLDDLYHRLPDVTRILSAPLFVAGFSDVVETLGRIPLSRGQIIAEMLRLGLRREVLADNPALLPGELLTEREWRDLRRSPDGRESTSWRNSQLALGWSRCATHLQDSKLGMDQGQIVTSVDGMITAMGLGLGRDTPSYRAACDTGVIVESDGQARFFHQLFQEYLASLEFSRSPQWNRLDQRALYCEGRTTMTQALADTRSDEILPPLPRTGWEMTAAFVLDEKWNDEAFWQSLLRANPLLALQIALEHRPVEQRRVDDAATQAVSLYGKSCVDIRVKLSIADILGRSRVLSGATPLVVSDWIGVPAGRYVVGCDSLQFPQERPQRAIEITAVQVSRFPVTNAEYRLFMEDGGYENELWWPDVGARAWLSGTTRLDAILSFWLERWGRVRNQPQLALDMLRDGRASISQAASIVRMSSMTAGELEEAIVAWFAAETKYQPRFWDHTVLAAAYSPVVGVSWFEAQAYCAWRSANSGESIRLLTEWEWEACASGPQEQALDGRNELNVLAQNTAELRLGRTTPIGVFAEYPSWCGALEMLGNVFEWTSSPYNTHTGEPRVCRGGSWRHASIRARAAYRGRGMPYVRNDDLGFRIARDLC